ncbi:MAG: hypothetical protein C5B58_13090 [Acidobacteria bacterium]|nr:MAG: hypothetical protein C5B58_13090 [Acidobacteriota bacterium]
MKTNLSHLYAVLVADPESDKFDWFDIALRRLGGLTKAANSSAPAHRSFGTVARTAGASLSSQGMMDIAKASGVPLLGLMVQCNRELEAAHVAALRNGVAAPRVRADGEYGAV